jgi:hypothetical protein
MNGTGSESCSVIGFGINGGKTFGFHGKKLPDSFIQ